MNTLHSSKMYNAAICEWQHQTKLLRMRGRGDFAGNKASTAVSTAIFLMCFSCTVRVGLGSSCKFYKKCSCWLMTRRQFSVRIRSSQLSVWHILQKGKVLLAKWFSSEIIKQVINFHAENAPSSWDKPDDSLLNAQLHLKSFPRMSLPARIPKSSDTIAAQSLLAQKSRKYLEQCC